MGPRVGAEMWKAAGQCKQGICVRTETWGRILPCFGNPCLGKLVIWQFDDLSD